MSVELHLADFQAFTCTACGLCCTRPWNVRIEPEVEEGIRASKIHARREREGYVPLEVSEGRVDAHRQDNDDCMFLESDTSCGLHSELGGRAKPVGCQLYPYHAKSTPSGLYFTLSFACPPVVAGENGDLEANRADLTEIMQTWPDSSDLHTRAVLAQNETLEISWQSYLLLEAWLLEHYQPERPLDSLLGLAASVSALSQGQAGWPLPEQPPLDSQTLRDLLWVYLTNILSILENETDQQARGPYATALGEGERLSTVYYDGRLPVLDLDRDLPDWALKTFHRFIRNQFLGKSLLAPSVVGRLLALATGYAMLCHYAEGFREFHQEDELSLLSLTKAFEIVEADAISHSSILTRFFIDFEETLAKFLPAA